MDRSAEGGSDSGEAGLGKASGCRESVEGQSHMNDLQHGLAVVQRAVDLMNNNRFKDAQSLLQPRSEDCMFHSLAYGTVIFLQAAFGMDKEVIDKATTVLNRTVEICNRSRRSRGMMETLSSWVFGHRLDSYSLEELTAEVFYAEANLLLSFLTFLQDESFLSFVKGALRIRSCHSLYKQLYQWLSTCEHEGIEVDANFASGVQMGYGCFNLFLSLLPARILRLLEFAGFSGNREVGLRELEKGAASSTFRAPLCSSFLLFYYTVAAVVTGMLIDPDHSEALLRPQLQKYPSSVQFLFFKGRIALMRGQVDQAILAYHEAISSQDEWHQVKHLCWWELAWCHCIKTEWSEAARYSAMLYQESRWSKASFLYMQASFSLMDMRHQSGVESPVVADGLADQTTSKGAEEEDSGRGEGGGARVGSEGVSVSGNDGASGSRSDPIGQLMKNVPPLKHRIAGKTIPIEQFSVTKSERYMAGARLPVPGIELMYTHNAFILLRGNKLLLRNLLVQVEQELASMEDAPSDNPMYIADLCVINLVKGCILRVLGEQERARAALLAVRAKKKELTCDLYCIPAATAELGLLLIELGELEEAALMFEEAKSQYRGYHLENRIHFRLHEGQNRLAACKKQE